MDMYCHAHVRNQSVVTYLRQIILYAIYYIFSTKKNQKKFAQKLPTDYAIVEKSKHPRTPGLFIVASDSQTSLYT